MLNDFLTGYIEAMYFTETGSDHDIPSDVELDAHALDACKKDCAAFISKVPNLKED
jgi:hypothetical protein